MLSLARKLSHPLSSPSHLRPIYSSSLPSTPTPSPSSPLLRCSKPLQNPLPPPLPPPILLSFLRTFSSKPQNLPPPPPLTAASRPPLPPLSTLRGGCYDGGEADGDKPPHLLPLCPGCGVHMQSSDPSLPGFFSLPSPKSPDYHAPIDRLPLTSDDTRISLSLKAGLLPQENEGYDGGARISSTPPGDIHSPSKLEPAKPVVCARCHSLRHYGRVKDPSAENLLPDFDFDRMVGPKMVSPSGPRSIVLMVVDAADFDGSFPRKVARLVSSSIEKNSMAWKEGKPGNVPRVVLVVTKIDLLPSSISPDELEDWVRTRARVGGANKLTAVHLVSAARNWGVRNLVEHVTDLVGVRGNVWAVGAQNAGKSTLINAMGRCVGEKDKLNHLTEAPVPGTTLGIIRVEGIFGGQVKLFDTPGILHPHQITTRLTRDEQKLVYVSKELRPRTYRIKVGQSIHVGGLMRLDIEELSVDSIYVTVWASPLLPLHMGKMENAYAMIEEHFGRQLQPPNGENRVKELGNWGRKEFSFSGNSWDASFVDIATAGLGWFALGLKGDAVVGVWTYDGIDIVLRNSLISKRASIFEEAGFTISNIVSRADSLANKQKHSKIQKKSVAKGTPSTPPAEIL